MEGQKATGSPVFRSQEPSVEDKSDLTASIDELDEKAYKRMDGKRLIIPEDVKLEDPPFSIYSKVKVRPFTADHLELGQFYGKLKSAENVAEVEEFVRAEIRARRYQDTTDSAKQVLDELKNKIIMDENLHPLEKLTKIRDFIRLTLKERKLQTLKEKMIYMV